MEKYRIIVISVALKNNRVAKYGEIVDAIAFASNPKTLEKLGYIEFVKEKKKADDKTSK